MTTKQVQREIVKNWRLSLDADFISKASHNITGQLQSIIHDSSQTLIASYYPINQELSPLHFLNTLKESRFVFPRYNTSNKSYELALIQSFSNDFQDGKFSCLEPKSYCPTISLSDISYWIIPGLAFDLKGSRLGYGAGIYDRLLSNSNGLKIGLSYDETIVDSIPNDVHDKFMNIIVTPTRTITID